MAIVGPWDTIPDLRRKEMAKPSQHLTASWVVFPGSLNLAYNDGG